MERVFFLDLIHGESVYCLEAVRHAGGINLSLALVGKVGTCYLPGKGETQVIDPRGQEYRYGSRGRPSPP